MHIYYNVYKSEFASLQVEMLSLDFVCVICPCLGSSVYRAHAECCSFESPDGSSLKVTVMLHCLNILCTLMYMHKCMCITALITEAIHTN